MKRSFYKKELIFGHDKRGDPIIHNICFDLLLGAIYIDAPDYKAYCDVSLLPHREVRCIAVIPKNTCDVALSVRTWQPTPKLRMRFVHIAQEYLNAVPAGDIWNVMVQQREGKLVPNNIRELSGFRIGVDYDGTCYCFLRNDNGDVYEIPKNRGGHVKRSAPKKKLTVDMFLKIKSWANRYAKAFPRTILGNRIKDRPQKRPRQFKLTLT